MNRQALLANAPNDAQWAAMSKSEKQSAVVNLAIAALSECAANGRELDSWEAQHLRSALGAIYTDFFSLSMNDVVLAMAPPEERATGWKDRFPQDIPTVHQFHRAFDQARYRPVPEN